MPIMAANERNDARTRAWLLAATAKEFLSGSEDDPDRKVVLNNVYRLLEAFKSNPFFGLEPPRHDYGQRGRADIPLQPRVGQGIGELRIALKKAMATAFEGQSEEGAITTLESTLRTATHSPEKLSPNDREKALLFLDSLIKNL